MNKSRTTPDSTLGIVGQISMGQVLADQRCMSLYATGFNAFCQLSFDSDSRQEEPADVFTFVKILKAHGIERPITGLSYTQVRTEQRLYLAGIGPTVGDMPPTTILSAEAANGEILMVRDCGPCAPSDARPKKLVKYASQWALRAGKIQNSWSLLSPVKAIAALDVGFVILYDNGTVATMGDARFEDCLGRDVSQQSPADELGIVTDLTTLGEPIRHVSAAGYTVAALTESGSVYLWGMLPNRAQRRKAVFSGLSRMPNYVEVGGGKDVQDFAIGEAHAIALTTDGSVYVIGDNANGQIGLGRSVQDALQSWTNIGFRAAAGQAIVAVAAGPRSSLILTAPTQDGATSP